MNDARDLTLILKSRFPLVVIETMEEPRVLSLLEHVSNLESLPLFVWSVSDGLKRQGNTNHVMQTQELAGCLRHIDATPQNGIYALLDAHAFLDNPLNIRLIREIALGYAKTARTLVFVSPSLELPPELARISARFELSVLDLTGVRQMIHEEFDLWRNEGERIGGDKAALEHLSRHLVGMTREDARRLIRQAVRDDSAITHDDVRRVLKFKHDALGSASVLTLELDVAGAASVAGQRNLKRWLANRRDVFLGAEDTAGLDAPKGILLLGVQGSGKSLAAKAVAGTWGVPLLRLDFGTLYNKFYGETEKNLRQALAAAEAMAPCVVWIDEIEKGLATDSAGDMDGGVSRRLLGTLLTWMAERTSRVFLVATANDIAQLPPELMRKGRFDEIFFLDLPDAQTRAEILRIHLERRKHSPESFDSGALADACDGFSGAEIEAAVVAALYEARARKAPLSTELIAQEMAQTKPLSVVMAERVEALREWAAERTVRAD
jgi:SpoVK/Ycf46/Vps4 family AAA+-type ATPase